MALNQGFCLLDIQFDGQGQAYDVIIRDANPAQNRIDGVQDLIGKGLNEVLPDSERKWIERYARVARSGQSAQFEHWSPANQCWYEVEISSVGGAGSSLVAMMYIDITQRRQLEDTLRQNQELNAFLLQLSDALRSLRDPIEIEATAARLLGEHLGANQVHYGETVGEEVVIRRGYGHGLPPMVGRFHSVDFGEKLTATHRAGRVQVVNDVETDPLNTEAERQVLRAAHIGAYITVPLIKEGRWVATLAVHSIHPRPWTSQQVESVKETAERTWAAVERARSEGHLRDSEEKFRSLFLTMREGFMASELIRDPQGVATDYRFLLLNPAYEKLAGLSAEESIGHTARELYPDLMDWGVAIYASVVDSGEPLRFENHSQGLGKWFSVLAYPLGGDRFGILYDDITQSKQREANQTFLADIADALARLLTTEEIMATVGTKIGAYLGVNGCLFVDVDDALGEVRVLGAWNTVDTPSLRHQTIRLADFSNDVFSPTNRAKEAVVVRNTHTDPRGQGKDYTRLGIGAFVTIPVHRHGGGTNYLTITQSQPRDWRQEEVALFSELASRLFPRLERARAEEALRQQEERTRIAIEAAELGTWEWNLLTNDIYWNEQHFRLFGLEPHAQPLTPEEFTRHVHSDDRDRIQAQLEQSIREKVVYEAEFRAVRQDGTIRWMSGYGRVTAETDGHSTRMSGVMFDIDERKRDQEALRQQQQQLRIVLESITDHALITTDTHRMITSWNPGAEHLFGFTAEEALGQPEDMLFTPEDRAAGAPRQEIETARRQGRAADERYHLRKDGSRFYVSGVQSPLYDETGLLLGYVKVARDLTQRRHMEQALRDADRRKDEFLATLAHELRNPLAPIRNTLQLLHLMPDANETVRSGVAMMNRQVDQLVRLIDDLLDVSRISRGKIQLRLEPIELGDVVRQAAEATRPLYEGGGRALTISLPQAPLYLQGDTTRLIQVVSNLLNNAAKFTTVGGKVRLTVERAGDESAGRAALLRVVDNGIGIATDQLERIFELFTQADNSLERSHNGLGLGLTLVRQLVELHGGKVAAYSEGLGKGSEFTVHLPLLAQSPQRPPASPAGTNQASVGRRILVVDDNPDAVLTLAMLLKRKGHHVYTRNNGQQGLAAAESLQPEVILLDIGMPGLNGYDTCRLIRQQPWGQSMVLIALTGFGQEEDKRLSQAAGFNAHLVKPVDLDALIELLMRLPGSTRATPPAD